MVNSEVQLSTLRWPDSDFDQVRLERMFKRLDATIQSELGTVAILSSTHRNGLVRFLVTRLLHRLIVYLDENDSKISVDASTPFPSLAKFASACGKLTSMMSVLRALPTEQSRLSATVGELLTELNSALEYTCRIRIYWIDARNKCYRGLASHGMKHGYGRRFNIGHNRTFFETEKLPRSAAQYDWITDTACQRLTIKAVQAIEEKEQTWYREVLGFGDVVDESYTWEFTADGIEAISYPDPRAEAERYVGAISLDACGDSEHKKRRLHPLAIQWMDEILCSPIGNAFAGGMGGLVASLLPSAVDVPVAGTAGSNIDGEIPLTTPKLKAIPAGRVCDSPWVFAEDDARCEIVYSRYEGYRKSDQWIGLLGKSGVGKEVIARALHWNGHRRQGPFVKVNSAGLNGELKLTILEGIADGTFTDQGQEAESTFAAADQGTLFWDEIFLMSNEAARALLSPLSDLQDRKQGSITSLGQVRDRSHAANIRCISAGDPGNEKHEKGGPHNDGHLSRRLLAAAVQVPGWAEISIPSRIALMRWHMLQTLRKLNLCGGQMSRALFRFLVYECPDKLKTENMGGLRNIWNTLETFHENGVFKLKQLEGESWSTKDGRIMARLLDGTADNECPGWLEIGENCDFASDLTPLERVVIKIAKCTGHVKGSTGCVTEQDRNALLGMLLPRQGSQPSAEDVCYTLYLLFAASAFHLIPDAQGDRQNMFRIRCDKKDVLATAPKHMKPHFRNAAQLTWLESIVGENLGRLTMRALSETSVAARFRAFVEQSRVRVRLLKSVERIACAYPPFLHHVPYWEYWTDGNLSQSGNIRAESVFDISNDDAVMPVKSEEEDDDENE